MGNQASSTGRSGARYLIVITGLALFLRVADALLVAHTHPPGWFFRQATELGELANSLANGYGLSSPFGGATGPSAFLAPGYPVLVAALFRIFGSYSSGAALSLMLLQSAFGAATVLGLMLLVRRTLNDRVSMVSGALLAFHPWLIVLTVIFWETALSVLLMLLVVWLAVLWAELPTLRRALLFPCAAGVAITVNPSLAFTCTGLLLWCIYRNRKQGLATSLAAMGLLVLLCAPWPLRNMHVMHRFIPLRDNLGYELWQGNRPGADVFFAKELHPNVNMEEFKRFQALGELAYMDEKSRIATATIKADPLAFAALTAKRTAYFWLGIGRQLAISQVLVASLTSFLGITGLVLLARRRGSSLVVPLCIPLALFPLPYYITHPDFRFWCVLSPILTALGTYAVFTWTSAGHRELPEE